MSFNAASVIAFVPSTDLERSAHFYKTVLGLPVLDDGDDALVFQSGGTMLRVTKVAELTAAPFTVLGWGVEDIHQTIAELAPRGVEFVRFEDRELDEAGVWTSPHGNRLVWFRDPDGNVLSLTQFA